MIIEIIFSRIEILFQNTQLLNYSKGSFINKIGIKQMYDFCIVRYKLIQFIAN